MKYLLPNNKQIVNKTVFYLSNAFFLILFLIPSYAFAAEIVLSNSLQSTPAEVGVGEQWYMDVLLDVDEESINGVEGIMMYSHEVLKVVRIENTSSIVGMWYLQPYIKTPGIIEYGGIMPNGFSGLIDPFDNLVKKPGKLFRIIFEGKVPGEATISFKDTVIANNDGMGTISTISPISQSIVINNNKNISTYSSIDSIKPVLNASRVRDPLLYDNQWVIIFSAADQQSGIAKVQIQEKFGEWITAESPYLVQDQSMKGIMKVRAIDNAGNVTTVTVQYNKNTYILNIILILILLGILIKYRKTIVKKIYGKK